MKERNLFHNLSTVVDNEILPKTLSEKARQSGAKGDEFERNSEIETDSVNDSKVQFREKGRNNTRKRET
jgi:hypothetical protein